jgi:lipoprotein YgeR
VRRFCAFLSAIFVIVSGSAAKSGDHGPAKTEKSNTLESHQMAKKRISGRIKQGRQVYRVRKGDTLYRIGKQFNIAVDDIRRANKMTPGENIQPGKVLVIPGEKHESRTSTDNETYKDRAVSFDNGKFVWPVDPVRSVKPDGEQGVKSIGIIISSGSNKVRTSASGVVEKIGRMRGFGNFIVIRHAGGYVSVYSGLGMIVVREGDPVRCSDEIGSLNEGTRELHFMIHRGGKPEDPLHVLPPVHG